MRRVCGNGQHAAELDLQQARYEASLAERRYAACDPDNRLIAAELEKSSETALQRVHACQARLEAMHSPAPQAVSPDLAGLADDLKAAWNAPGVSMRARQRLVRTLIADIVANVDEESREVVLTIHWRGGQHSQLRVQKPRSGEHGSRTSDEAAWPRMRNMAGLGPTTISPHRSTGWRMRTGQDTTWPGGQARHLADHRVNGSTPTVSPPRG